MIGRRTLDGVLPLHNHQRQVENYPSLYRNWQNMEDGTEGPHWLVTERITTNDSLLLLLRTITTVILIMPNWSRETNGADRPLLTYFLHGITFSTHPAYRNFVDRSTDFLPLVYFSKAAMVKSPRLSYQHSSCSSVLTDLCSNIQRISGIAVKLTKITITVHSISTLPPDR